ncbi:antimicrobial resistance protein Mig-14 [Salmonella enterica]|nr:antimicrobial resistance protein Mig-14 [Salmonella enterica subsp. houtenae]EJT3312928.1 antimicrobial resistance protein Mig-14 [Salmonella enterica]ELD3849413.1 antimicrobial resistance protein Mig-14 [Salmonella enterica]ELE2678911.1 antimicrobial resistance protein Mig-14 [Salmonella enterica]ELQ9145964.1 antimicrobial resistance protein Mig-14 [Salmonella enterica]
MKIQHIKRIITHWETSSFSTYRDTFEQYGGSVNMHPDVVEYFMKHHNWKFSFFHYKKYGEIKGAYFVCNNQNIGILMRRTFPLSSDEVLIPLDPELRCFLPERTNKLSVYHRSQIINATWHLARKKQNCLIKDTFSSKFGKNRRNEYQKFLRNGGSVKSLDHFSGDELAQIYQSLFRSRFGDTLPCYPSDNLTDFFSHLRHLLYGCVLYVENAPCAFDIVLKAESRLSVYFDVPNGGVKKEYMNLSPGSILMWLNVNNAKSYCQEKNKKFIFSIGALRPEWEYKLR